MSAALRAFGARRMARSCTREDGVDGISGSETVEALATMQLCGAVPWRWRLCGVDSGRGGLAHRDGGARGAARSYRWLRRSTPSAP